MEGGVGEARQNYRSRRWRKNRGQRGKTILPDGPGRRQPRWQVIAGPAVGGGAETGRRIIPLLERQGDGHFNISQQGDGRWGRPRFRRADGHLFCGGVMPV